MKGDTSILVMEIKYRCTKKIYVRPKPVEVQSFEISRLLRILAVWRYTHSCTNLHAGPLRGSVKISDQAVG
jgi:Holliday junction resolvase